VSECITIDKAEPGAWHRSSVGGFWFCLQWSDGPLAVWLEYDRLTGEITADSSNHDFPEVLAEPVKDPTLPMQWTPEAPIVTVTEEQTKCGECGRACGGAGVCVSCAMAL